MEPSSDTVNGRVEDLAGGRNNVMAGVRILWEGPVVGEYLDGGRSDLMSGVRVLWVGPVVSIRLEEGVCDGRRVGPMGGAGGR